MNTDESITAKKVMQLVERQRYRCALTGRELTPSTASLDHKMPLSRVGQHSMSNLWIVHREINAAKGTMTIDEFIALCREVSEHQRSTHTSPNDAEQ